MNEQSLITIGARHSCPGCKRAFETLSALVSHSESSRRCGIKDRASFAHELGLMTGGVLWSERVWDVRTVEEGGPQGLNEMVNKIREVQLDVEAAA